MGSFAQAVSGPLSETSLDFKGRMAGYFLTQVGDELVRSMGEHPPLNSLHEAYAVILEEVDELWDEVRKKPKSRNRENVRNELLQIAAMAVRTAVDLGYVI